jgi:periplasmic divalent cation tolerance protein
MISNLGIGLTTCQSEESATTLTHSLLSKNLIACGQINGPITSIYSWNGKLTESEEWRVVLKFKLSNSDKIESILRQEHEYKVPQWVIWTCESSEDYARWVNNPSE